MFKGQALRLSFFCNQQLEEANVTDSGGGFDEVRVFEGIAERTGMRLDRAEAHGRRVTCRSFSDLAAKSRRLGDGYYYLAANAWPEGEVSIDVRRPWQPLGAAGG